MDIPKGWDSLSTSRLDWITIHVAADYSNRLHVPTSNRSLPWQVFPRNMIKIAYNNNFNHKHTTNCDLKIHPKSFRLHRYSITFQNKRLTDYLSLAKTQHMCLLGITSSYFGGPITVVLISYLDRVLVPSCGILEKGQNTVFPQIIAKKRGGGVNFWGMNIKCETVITNGAFCFPSELFIFSFLNAFGHLRMSRSHSPIWWPLMINLTNVVLHHNRTLDRLECLVIEPARSVRGWAQEIWDVAANTTGGSNCRAQFDVLFFILKPIQHILKLNIKYWIVGCIRSKG